ncbi:MAG TPA: ThiF family adenylyltransferase [Mycobacteriales bacterium]|nr:ThiF family adenylyltransferase [Mycobacteriales bacterium]
MSEPCPQLLTGLRPLWRDQRTLQLGLDAARGIVVDGIDQTTARVLVGLDGSRSEAEVLADAAAIGADRETVTRLVRGLRQCGLVVDGEPVGLTALGRPDTAERLEPDRAGLSLASPARAPISTLLRRRDATVAVHGAGRLGAPVATLLGAAGVGRVRVIDREMARPCDAAPGGLAPSDAFTPRLAAAMAAVRRAAPETEVGPIRPREVPDLVVLTGMDPVEPQVRAGLHRIGAPHLPVSIRESTAVVGPLVLPGLSSCLTCADLQRRDRDPAWPVLAAQLSIRRRRQTEPCDVTLAIFAASLAVLQALTLLDGGEPATLHGTLELRLPDWRVRRRTWPAHPHCDCGAGRPNAARQRPGGQAGRTGAGLPGTDRRAG